MFTSIYLFLVFLTGRVDEKSCRVNVNLRLGQDVIVSVSEMVESIYITEFHGMTIVIECDK